jgi:hypothetical protein
MMAMAKKTLANLADREEILERLGRVRPDSQRRWGKMTPDQMICHLADAFRGVVGELPLGRKPGIRLGRQAMKWVALHAPMKWPPNIKTMPEMDQLIGGTKPAEFARDVEELRRLVARFTKVPRDFAWKPHPIFFEMTEREWLRWGYLHMDHHFRQFGV